MDRTSAGKQDKRIPSTHRQERDEREFLLKGIELGKINIFLPNRFRLLQFQNKYESEFHCQL
jgi:hypothetical protein